MSNRPKEYRRYCRLGAGDLYPSGWLTTRNAMDWSQFRFTV